MLRQPDLCEYRLGEKEQKEDLFMICKRLPANSIRTIAAASISLFVAACGGGGGGGGAAAVPPPNRAPTVDAGADQSAQGGGVVILSGSATDPDGDPLTYSWTQTGGPVVQLENASSLSASFDAPVTMGTVSLTFEFRASDSGNLSAMDATDVLVSSGFTSCTPTSPPAGLGLDSFYEKYCDANGIPVVSSNNVPDQALEWVRYQALEMLKLRPDLAQSIISRDTRIAVMAATEVTTDIPEHSDLYVAFPGIDWDVRARGLGATPARPASSSAEENILCYNNDAYLGENIFIHEFAHTVHIMGLAFADPTFESRLQSAYDAAIAAGLWSNTYAATNKEEYFAEGVQDWFDANLESIPSNGIHNQINTRAELAQYDAALYQLILEIFPESNIPACPGNP